MIGPGQGQFVIALLFATVLARPVVEITLKLTSSLRGWAWLGLILLGALTFFETGKVLKNVH